MSWAKSRRILLVWPGFEKVALRPVDLRILKGHARYLGSELGLVTRQAEIQRAAHGFGIPVFRSTAEAQRRMWPPSEHPTRQRRLGGVGGAETLQAMREGSRRRPGLSSNVYVRIGSFSSGVLAVLVLAAVFVPSATIRLTPISREQAVTLPVKVSVGAQAAVTGGSVSSRPLNVSVSGTQTLPISSTGDIPQDKAAGSIDLKNLTNISQDVPAGTIVYSISPTSARFATQERVVLPANVGALIGVPIQAVQAGAVGNVPANSIQAVEGAIGASISVTNPAPTSGGTNRTTAIPNADDRARVRSQLVALLQSQAVDKMATLIGPQDVLLVTTLKAGKIEMEKYEPAAGEPGAEITLNLTMDFQAAYVKADDLRQMAIGALNASAPAGYIPDANSLTFDLLQAGPSEQSDPPQFEVRVKCTLVHEVDLERAAALARGSSPALAAARLRSEFPLATPPEISLSPSWWPWLPLIPFRLTVTAG